MESERTVDPPLRLAVVGAVIANPWAGLGFVEDLGPQIRAFAAELGPLMSEILVDVLGGADGIEAIGKAAMVGVSGELEHASALIHTLYFGDEFRSRAGATAYLPFTNLRAAAGAPVLVPLIHKLDSSRRSHYLTAHLQIADAPNADEIVVAIGGASGGRPFARIGDRHQDIAEMKQAGNHRSEVNSGNFDDSRTSAGRR